MIMPSSLDPYAILSGSTAPNAFYLCLSTTDINSVDFVSLSTLQEVDTSEYQRIQISFDVLEASDNSNLIATCDSYVDDNGQSQYLDFVCGDNDVDIEINTVYVIASWDDQDSLLYYAGQPSPQYFQDANSTVRVPQITIVSDTWTIAA